MMAKFLVDTGKTCAAFYDETVRGIKAKRVRCDEIWNFTYTKAKTDAPAEIRRACQIRCCG